MSEALVNSQTQRQWCYRALTAEARIEELEQMVEAYKADTKDAEAYADELEVRRAKAEVIVRGAGENVAHPVAHDQPSNDDCSAPR